MKNFKGLEMDATAWGPYVRFEHDNLDSLYFPYQGMKWDMKLGHSHVSVDGLESADGRSEGWNYQLSMIKPWSWDRHSLNLILEGGARAVKRWCRCIFRIWADCSASPVSSATS